MRKINHQLLKGKSLFLLEYERDVSHKGPLWETDAIAVQTGNSNELKPTVNWNQNGGSPSVLHHRCG